MIKKSPITNHQSLITNRGFTLIELLVVISILGLLAALLIANLTGARDRARDSVRKSDMDQMKKAFLMHKNDYDTYPFTTGSGIGACSAVAPGTSIAWGESFTCGSMQYMKLLPDDPLPTQDYSYSQRSSGLDFCLWINLENQSDGDAAKSRTKCSASCPNSVIGTATYTYVVCAD